MGTPPGERSLATEFESPNARRDAVSRLQRPSTMSECHRQCSRQLPVTAL